MIKSLARLYGPAIVVSLSLITLVGIKSGWGSLLSVLILAGLEITFSFDNAVVNARILERMSPFWQQLFMTVGIAIAVFGVRVLLPIGIVALSIHSGMRAVVDMALHHPDTYAEKLLLAHPSIAAFGGIFLLMLFLHFILQEQTVQWLKPLEQKLAQVGQLEHAASFIVLAVLGFATAVLTPEADRFSVVFAGLIGMATFLLINGIDGVAKSSKTVTKPNMTKSVLRAGLVGFLYLELIDASFSLDGVIGAFAITNKIVLIAVGLGIGALFVRSMTVHMLRKGVLQKYRYMEHGAHYAIFVLALLMLLSLRYEIPDVVAGLSGVLFIGLSITHSHIEAQQTL